MISIIIPAFNEEESIAQTIKDVHSTLKILKIPDYEVLVVNDGSIDKTKQEAEKSNANLAPFFRAKALKKNKAHEKYLQKVFSKVMQIVMQISAPDTGPRLKK